MTVYVSLTAVEDRYHLWADTSDEAVMMLYGVGASIAQRRADLATWEAYTIDGAQFAAAVLAGATVTNGLGPAWWLARRNGHQAMVDKVEAAGGPFKL